MKRRQGRQSRVPAETSPLKKRVLLPLLVATVYLLHQDFWNWKRIEPLVLGFLPVGLAYHVGFSILAAVTMAVLVRFAWPKHLGPDPGVRHPNRKDAR